MFKTVLAEYIARKPIGSEATILEVLSERYQQEIKATHIIGSGCYGCVFDLGDDTVVKLTTDQEEIAAVGMLKTSGLLSHSGMVSIQPKSILQGLLEDAEEFAAYRMERIIPFWNAGLPDKDFKILFDNIREVGKMLLSINADPHEKDQCVEMLNNIAHEPYMENLVSLVSVALSRGYVFTDIHDGNLGFHAFERYTPELDKGLVLFDPIVQPLKIAI